jgi:hypothetical protein
VALSVLPEDESQGQLIVYKGGQTAAVEGFGEVADQAEEYA